MESFGACHTHQVRRWTMINRGQSLRGLIVSRTKWTNRNRNFWQIGLGKNIAQYDSICGAKKKSWLFRVLAWIIWITPSAKKFYAFFIPLKQWSCIVTTLIVSTSLSADTPKMRPSLARGKDDLQLNIQNIFPPQMSHKYTIPFFMILFFDKKGT